MSTQLTTTDILSISKSFAESQMFPDIKTAAQAMVKIQAGKEFGIQPFASMTGIHIIAGKPVIGAGLMASRVKASGRYDYRVVKHTDTICEIDYYAKGEKIGTSTFTIEDAKKAGTKNLEKFPKNMLFARAMSNGVKWYTPDIYDVPVYVPEEMPTQETINAEPISVETAQPTEETIKAEPLKPISPKELHSALTRISSTPQTPDTIKDEPLKAISGKALQSAITRIVAGEVLLDKLYASYDLTSEQIVILNEARQTFLNSQK